MATYYAWSPIVGGQKHIKVGEEVSQEDLGIADEEWDYLIEAGSIRRQKYPVPDGVSKSPVQHLMDEAAKLNSDGYVAELDDVNAATTPEGEGQGSRGW